MRLFLQSIYAILIVAISVACTPILSEDEPQTPQEQPDEKPDDEPGDKPNNGAEDIFAFEGKDIQHTSIKLNIIPEDKDMEYIVLFAEKKHFIANRIDTLEELINDDITMLREYAKGYNITIREFADGMKWLVKGDKMNYIVTNLYPDTEYVVYCYGVNIYEEEVDNEIKECYEATTKVHYEVITTTAPGLQDVTFNIKTTVTGNNVDIMMNPSAYDGLYYSYVVADSDDYYLPEGAEFSAEYIAHFRNITLNTFNELINNQGIPANQFCHSGVATRNERLTPNTNYMVVCFAVSDEQMPILCSTPCVSYFATEESKMSDLTIDIKVTDITQYNAMLTVTPSKIREDYACVFLSASQLPPYESEYEQMLYIIENFDPAIFTGAFREALTPLMPSTDYIVIAFGIENDIPTTEMFSYRFTSLEAGISSVYIESIDIVKVFDAEEIIALDSSYANKLAECECVAIVEAKTNAPASAIYFWWYEQWMRVEYSEEAFLEDLLMYEPANNPEIMDMYYSYSEQDQWLFAGIAEDKDGNMSEIFYGEPFMLTKDMCAPAEEFFPYVSNRSASIMLFRR